MKMSEYYCPTIKEVPSEAEIASHKLMLRAGMIRQLAAGIYSYLPFGYKVVRKVETIIRQELEKIGAQEVHLPLLHPAELWQESGRWQEYGPELVRLTDRKKRDFCIGPTHEEIITDLVRHELRSYKDLPVNLFQIQTKVRDEIRPRFGVMRSREFSMKDAYSFHANEDSLSETYELMYKAYWRIFERCGLKFRVVEADAGAIGGDFSHEFMVLAESGEDLILVCDKCDYAANIERAKSQLENFSQEALPLEKIYTKDKKTINDLVKHFNLAAHFMIKALLYEGDEGPFMVLLRGDHQVNEVKLKNASGSLKLQLVEDDCPGLPLGFIGPKDVGKIKIIADQAVMEMAWGICGGNEVDYHWQGVRPGIDFQAQIVADIRLAQEGETCPHCEGKLKIIRGIEVGHIFKLGTKYSEAMKASFLDEEGLERPFIMGCYGIGVTRTVAAAIEQNHDQYGIKWPLPLAPFQVVILTLGQDDHLQEASKNLYKDLQELGLDVLWDDRKERPGVKFNEADLLGIPLRIIVGKGLEKEGTLELKERFTGKEHILPFSEVKDWVKDFVAGSYY